MPATLVVCRRFIQKVLVHNLFCCAPFHDKGVRGYQLHCLGMHSELHWHPHGEPLHVAWEVRFFMASDGLSELCTWTLFYIANVVLCTLGRRRPRSLLMATWYGAWHFRNLGNRHSKTVKLRKGRERTTREGIVKSVWRFGSIGLVQVNQNDSFNPEAVP